MLHEEITEQILGAFYKVYNTLGFGFREKVYENSLMIELAKQGLDVRQQYPIRVPYEEHTVGEYFADIIVSGLVIIEVKAATKLVHEHDIQLRNYLKATDIEVGLLLNFGIKPEFKRRIFPNKNK